MLAAFGTDLLSNFIGSAVAGALLLWLGYLFVEKRLQLRERNVRRQEAEQDVSERRTSVLEAIHAELESNAAQLESALRELPSGGIPYPGFDVTIWPVVSEALVFTTLGRETISALVSSYNRMGSANEQLSFLADLNHGSTAVLVAQTAAAGLDDARVKEQYEHYQAYRDSIRQGLIDRLKELRPHLTGAIDAVERELGREGEVPAASRYYLGDAPGEIPPPSRGGAVRDLAG